MEADRVEIHQFIHLERPSLIVGWQTHDMGMVGGGVLDFLREHLGAEEIAEMKPLGFFPAGAVRVRNDIVEVQEGRFWACPDGNLLVFQSHEPAFDHHLFLTHVLDFAQTHYGIRELYTLSGAVSLIAHTHPRRLMAVFNRLDFKRSLQGYGLEEMTWEGPPAISSYLLWVAARRDLPGVSLWPEIPFYLAARHDFKAIKLTLSFLNRRLGLGLDLTEWDRRIDEQYRTLALLRKENAEVDQYLSTIEKGLPLDEEGQLKLTRAVHEALMG